MKRLQCRDELYRLGKRTGFSAFHVCCWIPEIYINLPCLQETPKDYFIQGGNSPSINDHCFYSLWNPRVYMYVCVCVSIFLSLSLSLAIAICQDCLQYLFRMYVYIFIYLFIYLFMYLFIYFKKAAVQSNN